MNKQATKMNKQVTYHGHQSEETKQEDLQAMCKEFKFKRFIEGLKNFAPVPGKPLAELHYRAWFGKNLGMALVVANVAHPSNPKKTLPGISFIRGDSVAILVILNVAPRDKTHGGLMKKLLLKQEARVPVGLVNCIETVAGMREGETPALHTASAELFQEIGFEVDPADIMPLRSEPILMSQGGSDERMWLYCVEKNMTDDEYDELMAKNRVTTYGVPEEHEYITAVVIDFDDWKKINDSKLAICMAYYLL
jgi:hypothetical protein